MIPDRFALAALALGLLIGAVLWFCGAIPWWAIPLVPIGGAVGLLALVVVALVLPWLASGGR